MGLFRFRCADFPESRTVLYPPETQMELILSRETVGAAQAEGLMQNRRSSDPSEIFDIRDYVPGDDIRTVHWKLSAKTGSLIVRQASDPSHYDAALLPDLGLRQQGETRPTAEELVRAVSVTVALGEGLLRQGTAFCMVIPIPQGLELHEVRSTRAFARFIPQWMGVRIPAESGLGLHFFQTEHLESYFTRLLVVSAGRYAQDPGGLVRRCGVTVISCDGALGGPVYSALSPVWESVALPAKAGAGRASASSAETISPIFCDFSPDLPRYYTKKRRFSPRKTPGMEKPMSRLTSTTPRPGWLRLLPWGVLALSGRSLVQGLLLWLNCIITLWNRLHQGGAAATARSVLLWSLTMGLALGQGIHWMVSRRKPAASGLLWLGTTVLALMTGTHLAGSCALGFAGFLGLWMLDRHKAPCAGARGCGASPWRPCC